MIKVGAFLLCLAVGAQIASAQKPTYWGADALGKNQVPKPIDTKAKGILRFSILNDTINGTVAIRNIVNMTMAHLHVGNASTNGPVALWTWPLDSSKPTVQPMSGSFTFPWITTAAALQPANATGLANWNAFIKQLKAGNIYFNVHTTNYSAGIARAQVLSRKKP